MRQTLNTDNTYIIYVFRITGKRDKNEFSTFGAHLYKDRWQCGDRYRAVYHGERHYAMRIGNVSCHDESF